MVINWLDQDHISNDTEFVAKFVNDYVDDENYNGDEGNVSNRKKE